jgi:hypothetical protein
MRSQPAIEVSVLKRNPSSYLWTGITPAIAALIIMPLLKVSFLGIALRARAFRCIFFSKRMPLQSLIRPCGQIRFAAFAPASAARASRRPVGRFPVRYATWQTRPPSVRQALA